MDDYPEVCVALRKKVDLYRIYWCKFVELATLSAWWLMVFVCIGTLCMNIVSRWMYRIAIRLTAYALDKTSHWNNENSRVRVIKDRNGEEDYLIRHYMFIKDRKDFPFNVFLHKFMKGDEEDIHDHPWGFFHLILSGGYYEHVTENEDGITPDQGLKRIWRGAGHWKIVGPSYKHRVELGDIKPWTIFIPFKRCREWGFWVKNDVSTVPFWKKVGHEEYLKNKITNKED
jgi:hypothetical protein